MYSLLCLLHSIGALDLSGMGHLYTIKGFTGMRSGAQNTWTSLSALSFLLRSDFSLYPLLSHRTFFSVESKSLPRAGCVS
ncbi:hypothetical protein GQ44DRAFT_706385 [Phaeosphaeriaceae sp. PMI808]|nr:hypothetical protein GQ44DRAFT_706385 [Phaeosphaeriaceae sp. PMI808]